MVVLLTALYLNLLALHAACLSVFIPACACARVFNLFVQFMLFFKTIRPQMPIVGNNDILDAVRLVFACPIFARLLLICFISSLIISWNSTVCILICHASCLLCSVFFAWLFAYLSVDTSRGSFQFVVEIFASFCPWSQPCSISLLFLSTLTCSVFGALGIDVFILEQTIAVFHFFHHFPVARGRLLGAHHDVLAWHRNSSRQFFQFSTC